MVIFQVYIFFKYIFVHKHAHIYVCVCVYIIEMDMLLFPQKTATDKWFFSVKLFMQGSNVFLSG